MEEEAKRRTLLRYIHAVKAAASLGLDDESHKNMTAAVGRPGRGIIQVCTAGGKEAIRPQRFPLENKQQIQKNNAHPEWVLSPAINANVEKKGLVI